MCLFERNTARRGRSAEPSTFLRTRRWRRTRASRFFCALTVMSSSLARLPGLLGDVLAEVPDALALVGLGLADLADVGGDLADRLLVDALHDDAVRGGGLEADALGGVDRDRVAEAEGEIELVGALGGGAVADADDLELLDELLVDAHHHVVDERPDEAVEGPVLPFVVGTLHDQLVAVLTDGDGAGDVPLEGALGALHGDVAVR